MFLANVWTAAGTECTLEVEVGFIGDALSTELKGPDSPGLVKEDRKEDE